MSSVASPPRLARRLLERALPADRRSDIIGDLGEVFRRRVRDHGLLRARWWYWREALMFSARFTRERAYDRRRAGTLSAVGSRTTGSTGRRRSLGFSLLDLKLGVRMLFKHPGLTLVGTLAISVAIGTVTAVHSFSEIFLGPHLPVPEGDRVVGIWNVDAVDGVMARQTLGDMLTWRDQLESVEDIGAFATYERVLSITDGETRSVRVAQLSPSAFRMLRVPPLMGRHLAPREERPGGPAVAVIGFDLWRSAFSADPDIVGKTIRLGDVTHAVAGVMPDGFLFPINEQVWTPAHIPTSTLDPGEGPPVAFTIGRLASGVTLDEAEAELRGIGARLASDHPDTHGQLRPRIEAYARSFADADDPGLASAMRLLRVLILVVLIVAAVNVGALVYARTAARIGEISVRSALGASRRRIAVQLFAEALVLASLGGALGFGAAMWILRRVIAIVASVEEGLPYWWDGRTSASTVLLVAGLVLVCAVMTGILPALGVTGRGPRSALQRIGAGDSGLSFGKAASTIVVGQVAISVAALTLVGTYLRPFLEDYAMDDGIARDEYLTAEVRLDRGISWSDPDDDLAADFVRNAETWRELGRRVSREPGVMGVTFGTSFPGMEHPVHAFQAQGIPLPSSSDYGHRSRVAWVEPGFFEAFDVRVLTGRAFDPVDVTGPDARVAVVNEAFVRRVLDGADAIGQLIRLNPMDDNLAAEWAEIVGVVPDLTVDMGSAPGEWPAIYFPLVGTTRAIHLAVRIEDDPAQFAGRLRTIGQALDASMVLHRPRTLEEMAGTMVMVMYVFGVGIVLLVLAALVLSTAGVYSLMSFTVAQRTREIGIRTALGAHPKRVVRDVFSRAILQVGAGTGLGLTIGWFGTGSALWTQGAGPIIGIVGIMFVMGLIACGYPVRRALRVQPTQALQES